MHGKRTYEMAYDSMKELRGKITNRFQLSTDDYQLYYKAVDSVFGSEIDYGQVFRQYGEETKSEERYSPVHIICAEINPTLGSPRKSRSHNKPC